MLKTLLTGLYELIFPLHCLICQKYIRSNDLFQNKKPQLSGEVCVQCLPSLKINHPPFCSKCSRHIKSSPSTLCKQCRYHPPDFDFSWGACLYVDPLKHCIYKFKYSQKTHYQRIFTFLMIKFINDNHLDIHQFDLIIPIPLSPARMRERTYNQSLLLAKNISHHYNIPLSSKILTRILHTKTQTQLTKKERWTNIKGAFRMNSSHFVKSKNILIIDDLLTTGATASEAAKVLKTSGAHRVGVLTLAIVSS